MSIVLNEQASLMDAAIGPVSVITQDHQNFNIDDYVTTTIQSKAEYLRFINKINQVDPLEVKDRPIVTLGGANLGGFDGV